MDDAKHTPGPWRWLDSETLVGDHGRRPVVLTARGRGGLQQRGDDGLLHALDCDDPNARLIAAAPDLLAALKEMVDYHGPAADHHREDCPDDDCAGCALDALVNRAIAKAEGRS